MTPGTAVTLLTDENHCFRRIFVCPAVSHETFRHCCRLIASDGTFLKAQFILTLLLAVCVDANGKTVVLA